MGMVDDGHVTAPRPSNFVYSRFAFCHFASPPSRGRNVKDHYYYCYWLFEIRRSLMVWMMLDVGLWLCYFLVHRLHSVFALVMFMLKSWLLQVFGITEFADGSHRRGGNGRVGIAVKWGKRGETWSVDDGHSKYKFSTHISY
jgi:hypothetical protein